MGANIFKNPMLTFQGIITVFSNCCTFTLICCFCLFAVNYIDIDFTLWLSWLLAPLLVTFVLPVIIVLLLYITALILYIYKLHWNTLRQALNTNDRWNSARMTVSALWDAHGWIWHGKKNYYEKNYYLK